MAQEKNKTPAQAARNKLSAAIRARGERGSNIWLVRPPFESRDLILSSDPQCEAFYLLEGEPSFKSIRYLPQWYQVQELEALVRPTREFAIVTISDGREIPVCLTFGTETHSGAVATLTPRNGSFHINLHVLDGYRQRTENWRRVIPCIRRVRFHSANAQVGRQLAMCVHQRGRSTIGELIREFSDIHGGFFYGALATLIRERMLHSDLDSRPWSTKTVVWGAES